MLTELNKKIIEARKGGDKFSAGVFNLVKAELLNNQKEAKPKPEVDVVKSYSKKLTKAISAYEGHAHFDELQRELDLIKSLLPEELSEEDIQAAVNQYLANHPDEKHIGKVIGTLKGQLPNADGSTLAKIVKSTLTSSS